MTTTGGGGGGIETTTMVAAAADSGPSAFVDAVINDFVASTYIAVSDGARDRIVNDVLISRDKWMDGMQTNRIDPEFVAGILTEALQHAAEVSGEQTLSADAIWDPFHQVLKETYNCPYPVKEPFC